MIFYRSNNSTPVLALSPGGNVGIGTTSPASTLQVNGTTSIAVGAAATPSLTFTGNTNTGIYQFATNATGFAANGTAMFYLDPTGFSSLVSGSAVLRGTTASAANPAFAFNGDVISGMFHPAANTIGFSTNGTEVMRITSTGAVGIGTASVPASVTEAVNGLVKVAGTGSEPCTASQVGSIRYNPTGNYFEL